MTQEVSPDNRPDAARSWRTIARKAAGCALVAGAVAAGIMRVAHGEAGHASSSRTPEALRSCGSLVMAGSILLDPQDQQLLSDAVSYVRNDAVDAELARVHDVLTRNGTLEVVDLSVSMHDTDTVTASRAYYTAQNVASEVNLPNDWVGNDGLDGALDPSMAADSIAVASYTCADGPEKLPVS